MIDYKTPLQTGWFDLLDGAITVGGDAVAVYDVVPETPSYPYIQFGDSEDFDSSTKSSFGSESSLQLSIVDRFSSGVTGSRKNINSVADDIFGLLKPDRTSIGVSATGFTIIRIIVQNDIILKELTPTYFYIRREMRFNHIIEEN